MRQKINIFFAVRIFIGCLFVVSGLEKLLDPYENFLYVIEQYKLLSLALEKVSAFVIPWLELFTGVFLIYGLWLKAALRATQALTVIFIFVVSQALIRKLPIDECGCLGNLISLPLDAVLMIDTALLLLATILLRNISRTSCLSLDNYFLKPH